MALVALVSQNQKEVKFVFSLLNQPKTDIFINNQVNEK